MVYDTRRAHPIELADQCHKFLATLYDNRSIIGKFHRNNKILKQSCFASNRIVSLAHNYTTYQIKPLLDQK